MADTKTSQTDTPTEEIANDMKPEPIFPGEVIPENEWEQRARYMREVVNTDDT